MMRSLLLASASAAAFACSNLLVSKGATADGSTILAYNADDVGLFGSIDLRPAATHAPGSVRAVWDWDSQLYTGQIPQVNATYNVVGNTNEYGVIITETTFGARQAQRFH
jgi:dipeptidase